MTAHNKPNLMGSTQQGISVHYNLLLIYGSMDFMSFEIVTSGLCAASQQIYSKWRLISLSIRDTIYTRVSHKRRESQYQYTSTIHARVCLEIGKNERRRQSLRASFSARAPLNEALLCDRCCPSWMIHAGRRDEKTYVIRVMDIIYTESSGSFVRQNFRRRFWEVLMKFFFSMNFTWVFWLESRIRIEIILALEWVYRRGEL